MSEIEQEITDRLTAVGVTPLIGGLVPEFAAADLLGYAPSYLRRLAADGLAPIPFVRRGNRRFYKIVDIARFATNTAA
ncbi:MULTISPECIES: DNA-binding protein [unclassified Pseudomonas]|mgnify:CR=1 FL=1|uniref:DNA-binding protein n=1 Tax=unclassified Pseudomonas TaxID=196821 RepID=UPI002E808133|nr:DNA-binding protein [Pseudomonas sp. 10C3]MEE3505683.1 DNA-binding protein [Pseudomonas sp. 10C3]